jgi:hypothetical protein
LQQLYCLVGNSTRFWIFWHFQKIHQWRRSSRYSSCRWCSAFHHSGRAVKGFNWSSVWKYFYSIKVTTIPSTASHLQAEVNVGVDKGIDQLGFGQTETTSLWYFHFIFEKKNYRKWTALLKTANGIAFRVWVCFFPLKSPFRKQNNTCEYWEK